MTVTRSLLEQSDRTRRHAYRGVTRDPLAAMPAEIARREFRRTLHLIRTAVDMAASERKRHGKDCPPEMRRDAAQDVAVEMSRQVAANVAAWHERKAERGQAPPPPPDIGHGLYPLADLIDQDRPTVSGHGGERIKDRPNRDLIAAAGRKLDGYLSAESLSLDAMAGDGATLREASIATRDGAESRRSIAAQVVDPTVSPVPADVEDAAAHCGLWPDDPARHALRVAVTGDGGEDDAATRAAARHPMTAGDWALIDAPEYRGRTAQAIRKRLSRGRDIAPTLARDFGRALAQCLAVTDPDPRADVLPVLSENPDGERTSCKLPDRWRVTIDQDASQRTRKSVPRKRRRQVPPMPEGWRRERGTVETHEAAEVMPLRTIEEIHAEHARPPRKRTRARSKVATRRGKLPAATVAHIGRLIDAARRMEADRRRGKVTR